MSGEPSMVTTAATAIFGFLFIVAFFLFRKPEERRFLLPLGVVAFVLRAWLVPTYYTLLVNAGLDGFEFEDSIKYHWRGIEFAEEIARGIDYRSQAWRTVDPGYPILTGIVYSFVGVNTLVMRMINCVLSTITLLWIYRIARLAFEDETVARRACYLLAFLPYPILYVITHRKDTLVAMLATFIFYHAMRMLRFERDTRNAAFWMVAGLAAMSVFRSGFILPFLAALFVCYMLTQRSLFQAVALSIPTVMLLAVIQLLIPEDATLSVAANTERLQGKFLRSGRLSEAVGLVSYVRMTSVLDIWKLPFASVLILILPFPPYFTGYLPSIALSWASLFNLIFLPHMIVGAGMSLARAEWKRRVPLLLFSGVFLVLLAAIHIGVIRYREIVYPTMLVLAGAGLARGGNTVLCAVIYFGLTMLGGVVLFARHF